MDILVRNNFLRITGRSYPCVMGRGGVIPAAEKCEGDGATPAGIWPLRGLYYRADRLRLPAELAFEGQAINRQMVWTDEPARADYNQLSLRTTAEAAEHEERLWRGDERYNLIIPLGYNDDPVIAGKGSAIFWHVTADLSKPTAGCVAMRQSDFLQILPQLTPASTLTIEL